MPSPRVTGPVSLLGVGWLLSIAVHGLVLFIPVPEPQPLPPAAPPDAPPSTSTLAVTRLPRPVVSQPPPAPESRPTPPAPLPDRPSPPPASPTQPAPVSEPTPPAPESSLPADAPPEEPPPAPTAVAPPGPLVDYDEAFPHPPGAEAGCFGISVCRRVRDVGNYRSVARSLIAGLEAEGYRVTPRDDLDDAGRNIYEVQSPETGQPPRFLMVFSDDLGSAVYVISDRILTLDELKALQVESG